MRALIESYPDRQAVGLHTFLFSKSVVSPPEQK